MRAVWTLARENNNSFKLLLANKSVTSGKMARIVRPRGVEVDTIIECNFNNSTVIAKTIDFFRKTFALTL